jgi:hypothetical protein
MFLKQSEAKSRIAELENRERELMAELRKAKIANVISAAKANTSLATSGAAKKGAAKTKQTPSEKQAAEIRAEFEAMSPGPARSRFYQANRDILRP